MMQYYRDTPKQSFEFIKWNVFKGWHRSYEVIIGLLVLKVIIGTPCIWGVIGCVVMGMIGREELD